MLAELKHVLAVPKIPAALEALPIRAHNTCSAFIVLLSEQIAKVPVIFIQDAKVNVCSKIKNKKNKME